MIRSLICSLSIFTQRVIYSNTGIQPDRLVEVDTLNNGKKKALTDCSMRAFHVSSGGRI